MQEGERLPESLLVARGDTGVVSVPAFLGREGREARHGPHRCTSLGTAHLELSLLFCSFPHQNDGLLGAAKQGIEMA